MPSQTDPTVKLWVFAADDDSPFKDMKQIIRKHLLDQPPINRGQWQTLDVSQSPAHATYELRNVSLFYAVPSTIPKMIESIEPDLPWADQHFLERVGGEPFNPPPSYVKWPHHGGSADRHLESNVFSHTYPERFWPKQAGLSQQFRRTHTDYAHHGIRYPYGDLDDVVNQLVQNPMTRQAVLPIWHPEDTGATDRRVPCTLTYHFMADEDYRLSMWYSIRACDFVRHFHNDVYFACRLLLWVCEKFRYHPNRPVNIAFEPGELNMSISSLHAFVGDIK